MLQHPHNCMQTSTHLSTFNYPIQQVSGYGCLQNTMAPQNRKNPERTSYRTQSNSHTSHQIKHFTLAIAVWCYSNRHFLSFVSQLQLNLSTLWKINGDAVNNLNGFVWNRLLPAKVSILVVLSSHLRALVNNLSEQVEAKMRQYHQLKLRETKFMYRWGEALCSLFHFCASYNCCLWRARFEEEGLTVGLDWKSDL